MDCALLPPTTDDLNANARNVCLLARLLKNACMDFDACRQVSGHGRKIHMDARHGVVWFWVICTAMWNFITSGKPHVLVLGARWSSDAPLSEVNTLYRAHFVFLWFCTCLCDSVRCELLSLCAIYALQYANARPWTPGGMVARRYMQVN